MDPIRVYNLGDEGVVVDPSPIHNKDGQFAKAQNAIRDPLGLDHGLHKRPGLVKAFSNAAAGSVLGGIGVPLVLLAASIGGVTMPGAGGNTPSLTGPAPGEGGGDSTGAGVGGGGGGGPIASGSGNSSGGSTPVTGKRVLYWGRATAGQDLGATQGWNRFAGLVITGVMPNATALVNTTPVNPRGGNSLSDLDTTTYGLLTGAPGAGVVANNVLYYPSDNYTVGLSDIPIYTWDGTTNQLFTSIPFNVMELVSGVMTAVPLKRIMSMMVNGNVLYVTVASGLGGANVAVRSRGGRVFSIDLSTKAITLLGSVWLNSDGYIPYSLAWHAGRLWLGLIDRLNAATAHLYFIRPGIDADWTLDHTLSQGSGIASMFSYNGELYCGSFNSTTQVVEKRDPVGAWTIVRSVTFSANAGTWLSMTEFNTTPTTRNLFTALWYPTSGTSTSRLQVHMQDAGGTWSIVYDKVRSVGAAAACCTMFVENEILYVGGGGWGGSGSSLNAILLSSVDGVTWLDETASLAGAFNATAIFGVLTEQVP